MNDLYTAYYRRGRIMCRSADRTFRDLSGYDGEEMIEAAVITIALTVGSLILVLLYEIWR